jgi:dihydropteroate synthase
MLRLISRNKTLLFDRPAIMGILNVTPDSFSDGGRYNQMDKALRHCEQMISDGADFIDIGGCSTRPNNAIATESEETERVVPILKAIRKAFPEVLISIDTFRKDVAEACMDEGADLINDISGGLFDEKMLPYIGQNHVPYVMMHCIGTPETMHQYTLGGDIHQTVLDFFCQQCKVLESYGNQQIILDPGIGFRGYGAVGAIAHGKLVRAHHLHELVDLPHGRFPFWAIGALGLVQEAAEGKHLIVFHGRILRLG